MERIATSLNLHTRAVLMTLLLTRAFVIPRRTHFQMILRASVDRNNESIRNN